MIKAALLIKQGSACCTEANELRITNTRLREKVDLKDSVILGYTRAILKYDSLLTMCLTEDENLKKNYTSLSDEMKITNLTLQGLQIDLRRQKRKTLWVSIVSLLGITYLLLK